MFINHLGLFPPRIHPNLRDYADLSVAGILRHYFFCPFFRFLFLCQGNVEIHETPQAFVPFKEEDK